VRTRSTLGLSTLVAVVVAFASGCGGGSSSSTATVSSTAAGAQTAAEKALFTYAACMRGKGVNIPDPVRRANGRYAFPQISAKVLTATGVRAKARACAAKLPQRTFRRGGNQSPAQRAALQKFSACMSANGVTFGGPGGQQGRPPAGQRRGVPIVPGQGPGGRGGFFNSTDPKVKAALAKCRKLLPAGFRGQGTP
jgi:hypothetical protein